MSSWLEEVQRASGVEKKPAETASGYLRRVADVNCISESLTSEVIEAYNRNLFSEGANLTPTDSPFTDFLDEIENSKPESKNDEGTTSEPQLEGSSSAQSSTNAPTTAENDDGMKRSPPHRGLSQPFSRSSKRSKLSSQVQQWLNKYSNTPSAQTGVNIQSTWFALILFVLVVTAAFVVRTQIIGDYPLHGDEAINIMHIRDLREAGRVWYRPFVHGISVYHGAFLTYPLHTLFSSQLIWARWIPASIWLIGIGSLWFIREEIGDLPLLTGAAVLGFHQFALRSSTLFRQDAILSALLILNIVAYLKYKNNPDRKIAVIWGAIIATTIATTEHAYVLAPTLAAPIIGATAIDYWLATTNSNRVTTGVDWERVYDSIDRYVPLNQSQYLLAASVAGLAFFFGEWPLTIQGVVTFPLTMWEGIEFALEFSGDSTRKSYFFYISYLTQTPILFALTAIGLVATFLRHDYNLSKTLFISWFIGSLVIFSAVLTRQREIYLIYMTTPMALLSGFGVEYLYTAVVENKLDIDKTNLETVASVAVIIAVILALTTSGVAYRTVGMDGPEKDLNPYYWPYDEEENMMNDVKIKAQQAGCDQVGWLSSDAPVKPIPRYYLDPIQVQYLSNDIKPSGLANWPMVLVAGSSVEAWNTTNTTVTTYRGWYIYHPENNC